MSLQTDIDIMIAEPAALQVEAAKPAQAVPSNGRKVYIESYGCQMNFSDSEIVMSILAGQGYQSTAEADGADVILINTCAIRENAETKIRHRLVHINGLKRHKPGMVVGVLGCMAERLKAKLLDEEKAVDMVVGPDAYRSLPELIEQVDSGQKAVNVFLSRDETYQEIEPVRLNSNGVTAYISIMRGCDNMCSFCVVPYTRGRERSRDLASIISEAQNLFHKGYKEVTLLGQNVDSYKFKDEAGQIHTFAHLLAAVAEVGSDLRVRFSTSHPKDMTDDVLETMAAYPNICNYIHLPAQSGNSAVLDRMHRNYTREWYIDRIVAARRIVGADCAISTDFISGFCGETDAEHADTLSLMDVIRYDYAYMFTYSERPNTPAAKKYADDVPEEIKKARLAEIITLQHQHAYIRKQERLGKTYRVLVEGPSKHGNGQMAGRNDQNDLIVFDSNASKGSYVMVQIESCTSATLRGIQIG